jgi:hypothetical protein
LQTVFDSEWVARELGASEADVLAMAGLTPPT